MQYTLSFTPEAEDIYDALSSQLMEHWRTIWLYCLCWFTTMNTMLYHSCAHRGFSLFDMAKAPSEGGLPILEPVTVKPEGMFGLPVTVILNHRRCR